MLKNNLTGPDFICVGPHKTGTGWLYETLNYHKEIFSIDEKEIRYYTKLDNQYRYPKKLYRLGINRALKWLVYGRFHLFWIYIFYKNIKGNYTLWWKYLQFESHFHLRIKNLKWYKKLFSGPLDLKKGDFSPSYATMMEPTIGLIKRDFPKVKIIYFLRDPVDRIWSHTKMELVMKNLDPSEQNIRRIMNKYSHTKAYKFYPNKSLNNWLSIFGNEQVFVGFFDYLQENPIGQFKIICQFLGINDDISSAVETNIEGFRVGHLFKLPKRFEKPHDVITHSWKKSKLNIEIPRHLQLELIKQYYDDVLALDKKYPNSYPAGWIRNYNQILSKNSIH